MFKGFDDNTLFQHTAARRRLAKQEKPAQEAVKVSTHSRPKAAGACLQHALNRCRVSTHSRPKAAGKIEDLAMTKKSVSTHSRPKAAGLKSLQSSKPNSVSTHSRPKAAGKLLNNLPGDLKCFNTQPPEGGWGCPPAVVASPDGFNTQPPEGGWDSYRIL